MASVSAAWEVYKFFNGTYDNVHAAYWVDPPAHASDEARKESAAAAAAESKKKEDAAKPKMVTVELKCLMCCEGCEARVRKALSAHSAFTSFKVDRMQRKVTVTGQSLKPRDVLDIVHSASRKSTDFWPKPPEKKDDKK